MGKRAASNTSDTLKTNTKAKKKLEDHIRKNKNSEEKLSCSLWREFSLRGCRSSESKIRCPIDSQYCDRFHNCSCRRKHKAKTKIIFQLLLQLLSQKKEHQEATSDMLLQPLRPPFSATFGILFQLNQWQPVLLAGAPLTFCLWLSYWC